jgi:peptide-methionine (S)-S-oxide reductase
VAADILSAVAGRRPAARRGAAGSGPRESPSLGRAPGPPRGTRRLYGRPEARRYDLNMKLAYVTLAFGLLTSGASAQPTPDMNTNSNQLATLGGGCFWCMEAVYERLPGVKSVTSGFAGGRTANPTYEQVCTGATGHAEVTQIEFDPAKISYAKLLEVFWQAHDPTTLNRQGADAGTQYRSVILYHDEAQKAAAEQSRAQAQKLFKHPIVTEIAPFTKFYPAENYHQGYFDNHSNAPYCQIVIAPKLEKLEKQKVIGKAPQSQAGQ